MIGAVVLEGDRVRDGKKWVSGLWFWGVLLMCIVAYANLSGSLKDRLIGVGLAIVLTLLGLYNEHERRAYLGAARSVCLPNPPTFSPAPESLGNDESSR